MSQKLKSVLLKRLRNCSIMRVNDESSKDMTKSLKNCRFTLIDWYSKNQHTSFKHKPLDWKNTLLCNTVHQSWEVQALIYITQCCKSISQFHKALMEICYLILYNAEKKNTRCGINHGVVFSKIIFHYSSLTCIVFP